jgi:ATP-dependent RNA helicase DDX27
MADVVELLLILSLDSPRRVPVTRVLVLTPTRELAAQCDAMTKALAKYTDIRVALIVGGLSLVVCFN